MLTARISREWASESASPAASHSVIWELAQKQPWEKRSQDRDTETRPNETESSRKVSLSLATEGKPVLQTMSVRAQKGSEADRRKAGTISPNSAPFTGGSSTSWLALHSHLSSSNQLAYCQFPCQGGLNTLSVSSWQQNPLIWVPMDSSPLGCQPWLPSTRSSSAHLSVTCCTPRPSPHSHQDAQANSTPMEGQQ